MIADGVKQTCRLALDAAAQNCSYQQTEIQTHCSEQTNKLQQRIKNLEDESQKQRALNQQQETQMKEKENQLQQQIQKQQLQLQHSEQQRQEVNQKLAQLDSNVQFPKQLNQGQFTGQSGHLQQSQHLNDEQYNGQPKLNLSSKQPSESLPQDRLGLPADQQLQVSPSPEQKSDQDAYVVKQDESLLRDQQQANRHQRRRGVSEVSCISV